MVHGRMEAQRVIMHITIPDIAFCMGALTQLYHCTTPGQREYKKKSKEHQCSTAIAGSQVYCLKVLHLEIIASKCNSSTSCMPMKRGNTFAIYTPKMPERPCKSKCTLRLATHSHGVVPVFLLAIVIFFWSNPFI